jgi:hypothetical protein
VTLLAVLDSDWNSATDDPSDGTTNSDWLMLLPYGVVPSMLVGFWVRPVVASCCGTSGARKSRNEDQDEHPNPLAANQRFDSEQ